MKLADIISISAGGPGSGCKGDNCGRPAAGRTTPPRQKQRLKEVHQELVKAGNQKKLVYLKYKSPNSDKKARVYLIEPYSYRGDKLFGYDRDSKSIKAFSLLGVVGAKMTEKSFSPRWKVEIR